MPGSTLLTPLLTDKPKPQRCYLYPFKTQAMQMFFESRASRDSQKTSAISLIQISITNPIAERLEELGHPLSGS
jgi:hypothetical protein